MLSAALIGFTTGFSLILAIGSQNAFVLRQGLAKSHVFPLVLFCAVSDAIFIAVGILGFSAVIAEWPRLPEILAWAGAAFLLVYGGLRLSAAYQGEYEVEMSGKTGSLGVVLATAAAFTWLNPHVYLDTMGLIGGISTRFEGNSLWAYGIGAVTASFVFFFALGFGARYLAPVMQSPRAWRILDVIIGIIMWLIAVKLIS